MMNALRCFICGADSTETRGCAGVAFFGNQSLEDDLKALEWAYKHLPLSYNLRIIHVNELSSAIPAREEPDSKYDYRLVEDKLRGIDPAYWSNNNKMADLQDNLVAYGVHTHIGGVTYVGVNSEASLKEAIQKLGLDTLVLAWANGANGNGPPIIIDGLESDGCSIVLAKLRSNDNENNRSPSSNDANTAGNAALEGFAAGVALFGQPSVEADLAAFEWAYKHLRVSENYRLRIIHVNEQNEIDTPRRRPGSQYGYPSLNQNLLENYPAWENQIRNFISNLETHNVLEHICGVTYDGENFGATLQCAITEEVDLDTIVLPWRVVHDANGNGPRVTINGLGTGGCSIVLAKQQVDRTQSSTEVSAAQSSTEVSAAQSSTEVSAAQQSAIHDEDLPTLEITIIAGTTQSANEPLSRNQNT